MPKRKKQPGTLADSTPLEISPDSFAHHMRGLFKVKEFQILRSHWLNIRGTILEAGKKKPTAEQWSVLAGFDMAVMEPEKWLRYVPKAGRQAPEADDDA